MVMVAVRALSVTKRERKRECFFRVMIIGKCAVCVCVYLMRMCTTCVCILLSVIECGAINV